MPDINHIISTKRESFKPRCAREQNHLVTAFRTLVKSRIMQGFRHTQQLILVSAWLKSLGTQDTQEQILGRKYEVWLESFKTELVISMWWSNRRGPFWQNTSTPTVFPILEVFPQIFSLKSIKTFIFTCMFQWSQITSLSTKISV